MPRSVELEREVPRVSRVVRVRGEDGNVVTIRHCGDQHVDRAADDLVGTTQVEEFGGAIVIRCVDAEVREVREFLS